MFHTKSENILKNSRQNLTQKETSIKDDNNYNSQKQEKEIKRPKRVQINKNIENTSQSNHHDKIFKEKEHKSSKNPTNQRKKESRNFRERS